MSGMAAYVVEVLRTERIYFQIDATGPEDAERRYLTDGDETGSESVESEPEVVSVTQAIAQEGSDLDPGTCEGPPR